MPGVRCRQIRQLWIYLAGTAGLYLTDQISKAAARHFLKGKGPVSVIRGFLEFFYLQNEGAAFGVLKGRQWIFILFALAITLISCCLSVRISGSRRYLPVRILCMMLSAGALGNMTDRLIHHYVIDFIYFKIIDFPVFNVADIYVTCSCISLIFLLIFVYKEEDLTKAGGNKQDDPVKSRKEKI